MPVHGSVRRSIAARPTSWWPRGRALTIKAWQADAMARRPPNMPAVLMISVAHLLITSLKWRDLNRRPPELVRGNKLAWRIAAAVNTMGSLAYLLFGRRSPRPGV